MAEEFYGRAKSSWMEQRYIDALYNLGIAIHLVQDMTVPTHVHIGENVSYDDSEFEGYVWNDYLLVQNNNIPDASVNYNKLDIGTWIHNTAVNTYNSIATDNITYEGAETSVKLAVESSAGVIFSFFQDVKYNEFYT